MNALLCLSDLVSTLDKHAVLDVLQTVQRCTAVDRSPPTLMCTLGIANSILKQVQFPSMELVLKLLVCIIGSMLKNLGCVELQLIVLLSQCVSFSMV